MMRTKSRIQRLAAIVAAVLASTSAVAAERTMFMQWTSANPIFSASASGQIIFDDVPDYNYSTGTYRITRIFDMTLTVSGAYAGDGIFGLSEFDRINFDFPSPLDFDRELIGQPLTTGLRFGDVDNDGRSGSFTLCGSGKTAAPTCEFYFDIRTGVYDPYFPSPRYGLRIASISPVPEPATAVTMLLGLGIVGWRARRR